MCACLHCQEPLPTCPTLEEEPGSERDPSTAKPLASQRQRATSSLGDVFWRGHVSPGARLRGPELGGGTRLLPTPVLRSASASQREMLGAGAGDPPTLVMALSAPACPASVWKTYGCGINPCLHFHTNQTGLILQPAWRSCWGLNQGSVCRVLRPESEGACVWAQPCVDIRFGCILF